jgi:hypothetical protein
VPIPQANIIPLPTETVKSTFGQVDMILNELAGSPWNVYFPDAGTTLSREKVKGYCMDVFNTLTGGSLMEVHLDVCSKGRHADAQLETMIKSTPSQLLSLPFKGMSFSIKSKPKKNSFQQE